MKLHPKYDRRFASWAGRFSAWVVTRFWSLTKAFNINRYVFRCSLHGRSVRLHHIVNSDPRGLLHSHEWNFWTLVLKGSYVEICPEGKRYVRKAGDWIYRPHAWQHRIELDKPCWTLNFCGPEIHPWGFFDPKAPSSEGIDVRRRSMDFFAPRPSSTRVPLNTKAVQ